MQKKRHVLRKIAIHLVYMVFSYMSLYMSKWQVNDVDKLFCMVSGEHGVDGLIKKCQMKDNLTNRHPWMTDGQSSHLPRSHIEESLDLELRLSIWYMGSFIISLLSCLSNVFCSSASKQHFIIRQDRIDDIHIYKYLAP